MFYVEPFFSNKQNLEMSRSNRKKETSLLSFCTTSNDAKYARQLLVKDTGRFLNGPADLRKPAEVTNKLRSAHARFMQYDRDSMKGCVGRIMKEDDIRDSIMKYFEKKEKGETLDEDYEEEDDDIVSENLFILLQYMHRISSYS